MVVSILIASPVKASFPRLSHPHDNCSMGLWRGEELGFKDREHPFTQVQHEDTPHKPLLLELLQDKDKG